MKSKVNLGCGLVYVNSSEWLNLDFVSSSLAVIQANLLEPLPLADGSISVVYSSHFLEHVPRADIPALLTECFRVLAPGGHVRLVLPDLENMCREFLSQRESGEHDKADFVVLEIIDQCVRSIPGGQLGRLYQSLQGDHDPQQLSLIDYVRERTGENLREAKVNSVFPISSPHFLYHAVRKLRRLPSSLRARLERARLDLALVVLPPAFRTQNVSLAAVGERHHWLWDFHQLRDALESAGFAQVQRRTATSSGIPDFPFEPLDVDAEGRPRKGDESMYVEACKPG